MSNKQQILEALRACPLPETDLASAPVDELVFPDPVQQFRATVEAVGGGTLQVSARDQIEAALGSLAAFQNVKNVWSLVPEIASVGGDWDQVEDPHALEVLDVCIVPGIFGVAENGAVWITDRQIRHRAALWIAQHVAIVLPANEIVHNMHDAYRRVDLAPLKFGVFISGPSKTADIEQSLVIGAHGPRSLTVVLIQPSGGTV